MSLQNRIEKLHFLVEEIDLGFFLASHAPDDFVARTLARHVLIRTENFIEHVRALHRPLKQAGYDVRHFHRTKEVYATTFEEYFKVSRNKLGAHVQDLDFGRRIELWNDIDTGKLSFFVDGAKELYGIVAGYGIGATSAYIPPPELVDAELQGVLAQFGRAYRDRRGVEFSSDPLAMTRSNTSAVMSGGAANARAGQLSLIRRWVRIQRDLYDRLARFSSVRRVVAERLLTDIVSFCDCLVTRPVSATAPQAMDGLDKLLQADGQDIKIISDFVRVSTFNAQLAATRTVRDAVGSHLELDENVSLAALLAQFVAADMPATLRFQQRVEIVFDKICREIMYLRMHAADGQTIFGVTAGHSAVVPFGGEPSEVGQVGGMPPAPDYNSEDAYRSNLAVWMREGSGLKREAQNFFWNATLHSEILETLTETDNFSHGVRHYQHQVRKIHEFLLKSMTEEYSDDAFAQILDLLIHLRSGDPYALCETIVRYAQVAPFRRHWHLLFALGDIASWPHRTVRLYVESHASILNNWNHRFQAVLASFKIFVRTEGHLRANRTGTLDLYSKIVPDLLAGLGLPEKLLCTICFASQFCSQKLASASQYFHAEYMSLQYDVVRLVKALLGDKLDEQANKDLHGLIATHDYVGVCLLISLKIEGGAKAGWGPVFLSAASTGLVEQANHDSASRHLALCFVQLEAFDAALEIANGMSARNPEAVAHQIFAVQVMANAPERAGDISFAIGEIRRLYQLTPDEDAHLVAVEDAIAAKC